MGLDGAEIIMEVEDRFGIAIPDEAMSGVLTVGDMFDRILAALKLPATEPKCLSALAFLSLRRAASTLGVRERLRPRDSIQAILPHEGRIAYWSRLQHESELTLPPLERPSWLVLACVMLVEICALVLGFAAYDSSKSVVTGGMAAVVAGMFAAMVAVVATRPFATFPSSDCVTLRRLAHTALRLNFQKLSERSGGRGREDVWIALREIIVNQLDISPDKVVPSARFVKDLGVG
jgi:acyl carrier protein